MMTFGRSAATLRDPIKHNTTRNLAIDFITFSFEFFVIYDVIRMIITHDA